MDEEHRSQIYNNLVLRDTEDLLEIWKNHDTGEWEEEVFEIVGQILTERLGRPPDESTQAEADRLLDAIDSHYQAGEFEETIRLCQSALEKVPGLSTVYLYLGLVYDEQGQLAQAFEAYHQVLQLDPENKDARHYLEEVEKKLEEEFEHSSTKQRLDRAVEYTIDGELEKALEECESVRQSMPRIASAYNYLGMVYEGLEKYEPAIDAYLEALKLVPRYAAARENLSHARKELEKEQYRKGTAESEEDQEAEEELAWDLDEPQDEAESEEEEELIENVDDAQDETEPEDIEDAPAWLYLDEKASILGGWPGNRTRPGRSGYDYLDMEFEAGHMLGVATHLLFTRKFRVQTPIYQVLLTILGFWLCVPLIGIFAQGGVGVIILYSPYWVIGVALLVNLFSNFDEESDIEPVD